MPTELSIRFKPRGDQADLVWDLAGQDADSAMVVPFGADTPLVLRMLDEAQHPHPDAANFYLAQAGAHGRLQALGFSDGARLQPNVHQRVGHAVYTALTADPAADQILRLALTAARQAGDGLDLVLRFPSNGAAWAALPWELLTIPDHAVPLLLEVGGRSSCTRYLTRADIVATTLPTAQPLTILALTPNAQIDRDWRTNQRAMLKAAVPASARLIMPEPPITMAILNDLLRQHTPQVLSFYGHGALRAGEGHLLLDSASGGEDLVPPHQLAPLFSTGGLRAVLLFSCYSSTSAGASFRDVASALSAAGVPAVVAMHSQLRQHAATRLQAVVCESLARGLSVQDAVAWGRLALYTEEQDITSWYVPTVTIAQPKPVPIYVVTPASNAAPIGGQQVVQSGMRRTANSWKTVAAGAAGAITVGALLAGGLAPLIVGGLTAATIGQVLGGLGSNALAGWLDRWATNAGDRLLKGDQAALESALARDLTAALPTDIALANDIATLLERTDGISSSLQTVSAELDFQTEVLIDVHDRLLLQETVITALRDDLIRTNLTQGRLHTVVISQLATHTTTIVQEIKDSTSQLDTNDQSILAAIEQLRATFAAQRTPMPTTPGNYAGNNKVQGNIQQTNTGDAPGGINHADGNTVGGSVIQTNQSGSINLGNARIGRMRDMFTGDKNVTNDGGDDDENDDTARRPKKRRP